VNAWRYFERRASRKEDDERWIKNDCTSRITKLEALLEASSREKDEMRQVILNLTAQVAELRTRVEFLSDNM
jgi:ribulose 1,5-bisphosphate carboxylase large subunit-like protein